MEDYVTCFQCIFELECKISKANPKNPCNKFVEKIVSATDIPKKGDPKIH